MYELTEEEQKRAESWTKVMKADCGSFDVEECINIDTEKFDRRKFGKIACGLCGYKFNPFYYDSIESGPWKYVWVGMSHKRPEQRHEVDCPNCDEKLRFATYIAQ